MAKTTLILEYILKMANNVEFDSDEVYISRKLYEYYDNIPNYSLNKTLDIFKISKQSLKKYLQQLGLQSYTDLKDEIHFEQIIRMKQIMTRYRLFDQKRIMNILEKLEIQNCRGRGIDLGIIDELCHIIKQKDRMIFYGSPSLLNLLYDFQIDMKIFGKTILISSVNNNKIIPPNENDIVGICTATGRLFGCCDSQFQEKILNTQNIKLLFTKDEVNREDMDYIIAMNTKNDYYEMHYLFMFYFDLMKTRYYEMYIKGQ